MQTRITLILDNPADPAAFEAEYPALAGLAFFTQLGAMGATFTGLFSEVEER